MACHDYPNLWDKSASFAQRRRQLAAARAQLAPDTFSPFSVASPAMIWWAAGYLVVVLAIGVRSFERRAL